MDICFENSYLCYISNSVKAKMLVHIIVVICSKILTFAI